MTIVKHPHVAERCGEVWFQRPAANLQQSGLLQRAEVTFFTFIIVIWCLCHWKSLFRCLTAASGVGFANVAQSHNGLSGANYAFKRRLSWWAGLSVTFKYTWLLTDWLIKRQMEKSKWQQPLCVLNLIWNWRRRLWSRERSWRRFVARRLGLSTGRDTRTGDTASTCVSSRSKLLCIQSFGTWKLKYCRFRRLSNKLIRGNK
jgi:hypothetical protein